MLVGLRGFRRGTMMMLAVVVRVGRGVGAVVIMRGGMRVRRRGRCDGLAVPVIVHQSEGGHRPRGHGEANTEQECAAQPTHEGKCRCLPVDHQMQMRLTILPSRCLGDHSEASPMMMS